MDAPGRPSPQLALAESQNILQGEQTGGELRSAKANNLEGTGSSSSPSSCTPEANPATEGAAEARTPVARSSRSATQDPRGAPPRNTAVEAAAATGDRLTSPVAYGARSDTTGAGDSALTGDPNAATTAADSMAESLALARELMEEEAMASYAAAVDIFRAAAGAGAADGVAAEDMAAMQALIEEDENSINAFATGEDESLDYDGMLELGSAIGDVRKERWRLRSTSIINALPRVSYSAAKRTTGDDVKCLVCQCEYEDGEDVRKLPCGHAFHTECVDGWLEGNEECPTCRRSISAQSSDV